MKLLVLGATGGIGIEIVKQSVARDDNVTALVRSPEGLNNFASQISVIQGDVLAPASISQAAQGSDAVLSAFGPRIPLQKSDSDLLRRFASALTAAMSSGLDWSIVRPPQLTDKPHAAKYRVEEGHLPFFGFKISRADVADFMISAAETQGFSRKIVGVCR